MMHKTAKAAIPVGNVREGVLDIEKSRFIAIRPYLVAFVKVDAGAPRVLRATRSSNSSFERMDSEVRAKEEVGCTTRVQIENQEAKLPIKPEYSNSVQARQLK
jgi:hypothetical protein